MKHHVNKSITIHSANETFNIAIIESKGVIQYFKYSANTDTDDFPCTCMDAEVAKKLIIKETL